MPPIIFGGLFFVGKLGHKIRSIVPIILNYLEKRMIIHDSVEVYCIIMVSL